MKTKFIPLILLICLAIPLTSIKSQSIDGKSDYYASKERISRNASALMHNYDMNFYFLDLQVERTSTQIAGNTTLGATVVSSILDTFVVELLSSLTIDSIYFNNEPASFFRQVHNVFILPETAPTQGESFSVTVWYNGTPSGSGFFSGISNAASPSWGNRITWTLSEPFSAHFFMPCKQVLPDKADSVWVFITTDSTNMAGANGLLTGVTEMPNGKRRYEWKSNYPTTYYLISFSVGQYVDYSIYAHPSALNGDSILIQNFVYHNPGTLPNFKTEIDETVPMLELLSDLLGLYPFYAEKYGHCMAPFSGGMEHQTMTTLGFFEFYLVAHELMHQWFGDYVTCGTWNDIWINEGFGVYGEYICGQYLKSQQAADNRMADKHANIMSQPGGSIYIHPWEALTENRIFDGRLSYDKGGAIIHTLRYIINNDSTFFGVLQGFLEEYANSTAIGDDFKVFTENYTGINLDAFFEQWYYGEGYPTYSATWSQTADSIYIVLSQSTSTTTTTFFEGPLQIKLNQTPGDTIVEVYHNSQSQIFAFPISKPVNGMVFDPANWIVNKSGTIINTSIDKLEIDKAFNLFPNPLNDNTLHLHFASNNEHIIRIIDLSGRCIKTVAFTGNQISLDMSDVANGLYVIESDAGQRTKFVKTVR